MAFVRLKVKYSMRTFIIIFFISTSSLFGNPQEYVLSVTPPFNPGEEISFKASIGFIKAAEAVFKTSDIIYSINDRPTYKMDINAKTTGVFDVFSPVRDNWGSYFDTTNYVPHKFYRYIKEGRYRKNEEFYFDHSLDSVVVAKLDKETRALKSEKGHAIPKNVQDMVSGYYYLRAIDFEQIKVGQVITIDTFYDDKLIPFKIKFAGRETIKTKLGKISALILIPMMEKDSIFVEDNLKVWLSDDLNKIPLRVKAKIFIGHLVVNISNVKNLRHQLALTQ
jgi:Protein of unknown function (DUF3108)